MAFSYHIRVMFDLRSKRPFKALQNCHSINFQNDLKTTLKVFLKSNCMLMTTCLAVLLLRNIHITLSFMFCWGKYLGFFGIVYTLLGLFRLVWDRVYLECKIYYIICSLKSTYPIFYPQMYPFEYSTFV